MRINRTFIFAGVCVAAIAGAAAAAVMNTHTLTVRLPGGGVERIVYTGDTPPRVLVTTAPVMPAAIPVFQGFEDPSFAAMDRISAQMDREMAFMMAHAQAMQAAALADPRGVTFASDGALPPGAQSFSFVSTSTGQGVCSRSIEITSTGQGQPRVVSHTSGDCAAAAAPAPTRSLDAAPAGPVPDKGRLVTASYRPAAHKAPGAPI